MMGVLIGFIRGLGTLSTPWRLWVGLLVAVNFVAPCFFLAHFEARVVLAASLLSAALQMAIFRFRGFVRLLGLGHLVTWAPMLIWLVGRAGLPGISDEIDYWLVTVLAVDSVSLVIDFVDVVRYVLGDRAPSLSFDDL